MADQKISEVTNITSAEILDTDEFVVARASTGENFAITTDELVSLSESAAQAAAEAAQIAAELARDEAEDARDDAQAAALTLATWTALSAVTGSTAGEGAEVLDSDTGTHTDPVVGGTVNNAGKYSWSTSPAGWERIGDTGLSGKATQADVTAGRVGFNVLTSVAGTGTAYTATGDSWADTDNQVVLFIPHTTSTSTNPTLSINGGTARAIAGVSSSVNASSAGQIVANRPYLLRRDGVRWRIINQDTGFGLGAAVVPITVSGTDGDTYTGTSGAAPLVNAQSIISIRPPVANSVTDPTLAINGGSALRLYTEDTQSLEVGQIKANGYYLGIYNTGGIRLLGVQTRRFQEAERVTHRASADAIAMTTFTHPLEGSNNELDPIYIQGGSSYDYWVASAEDAYNHLLVLGGSPRYLDLRSLRAGLNVPLRVYVASGTGKLITDGTIYTAAEGSLIEVWRPATGSYVFNAISGAVTEESDSEDAPPACDITLITAGQSHSVLMFDGSGLHGIQRGLRDFGSYLPSIFPMQGATGSTGVVPYTGPSNTYWWDPATSQPGPMATAWKAVLDAKPAGQPDPAAIILINGQNDAADMGDDATTASAAWKTAMEELIEWMRDQIDLVTRTPVIWFPLQGYDNNVSPTDAQVSAIRAVQLEMAAADPNLYIGPIYHDLYHPFQDQHPPRGSQMIMGYRLGAVLDEILNASTNAKGPYVSGITEESSGVSYLIDITADSGNPVYWPHVFSELELDGFAVYGGSDDPLTDTPITITKYERVSSTSLRLYLGTATSGAKILWPAGALKEHRAMRHLRNTNTTPVNTGWGNFPPLQPFYSGAF